MSTLRNYSSLPSRAAYSYDQPLTFRPIGTWFNQPNACREGQGPLCNRCSWLLHKVGRSRTLKTITEAKIEDFIWKNILCRFGIPNAIVTDNGRQFDNNKFRMFCFEFNINLCFASPAHPQSNGQVEAINKIIKRTLKTSLDKAKGCWPEFVPQVLWSYRTSHQTSTGETSFSLAFGTETVVPVELEQATFRVQNYVQSENDKQLTLNLDLVEEHRNQTHLRNVAYK